MNQCVKAFAGALVLFGPVCASAAPSYLTQVFPAGSPATPAFTTVPAPSSADLANGLPAAAYTLQAGAPNTFGGPATKLGDGTMQAGDDLPAESYFGDTDPFTFTINLGNVDNITSVNTYSRHKHAAGADSYRAPQKYTLAGSVNGTDFTDIISVENAQEQGAVYANSITDAVAGTLGSFQFLRFTASPNNSVTQGTFFGEIDVNGTVPEPASFGLLAAGALLLARRRRSPGH